MTHESGLLNSGPQGTVDTKSRRTSASMRVVAIIPAACVALLAAVSVTAQSVCESTLHRASCTSVRPVDGPSCAGMGCCWDAQTSECYFAALPKYKVCCSCGDYGALCALAGVF